MKDPENQGSTGLQPRDERIAAPWRGRRAGRVSQASRALRTDCRKGVPDTGAGRLAFSIEDR
ncbi:hypothetical protein [Thiocapsa rosea]|uniref:hypothetical protein n=1 Tax=Thiocapsa rosea TaxID=69360 RepID=UPI0011C427C3|nr:hypothetical protein [Thiocapsa rosea]